MNLLSSYVIKSTFELYNTQPIFKFWEHKLSSAGRKADETNEQKQQTLVTRVSHLSFLSFIHFILIC